MKYQSKSKVRFRNRLNKKMEDKFERLENPTEPKKEFVKKPYTPKVYVSKEQRRLNRIAAGK